MAGGVTGKRSDSVTSGPSGRGSADRRSDIGGAFGAIKGVGRGQAEAESEQRNRQIILEYPT
jgi:hypothetical protein